MIAVLILGAWVAAPPPASPAIERPIGVFVVPAPREALPRIRELVTLSAEAKQALEKDAGSMGFDPLDPASLEKIGIDAGSPIHLWIVAEHAPAVVELAIAKPELVDAAIARAIAARKKVVRAAAGGLYAGAEDHPRYAVIRKESRLFVQIAHARSNPSNARDGFPAIASAAIGVAPKNAPRIAKGAIAWGLIRGGEAFDKIEGGLWLESGRIEARAEAWLTITSGLLIGDLAGNNSPARRLLDSVAPGAAANEVAAELALKLSPRGLAASLEVPELTPEMIGVLSGELHAILTRGGSVVAAIGLTKDAPAERVEALRAGTEARLVEKDGERTLVAVLRGGDQVKLDAKAAARPGAPAKPIEARIAPKLLFEALNQRARAKDKLQLSRSRVAAAEFQLGELARSITAATVAIGLPPGSIEASLVLEYSKK